MTETSSDSPFRARVDLIRSGYFVVGVIVSVYILIAVIPSGGTFGIDAFAYWSAEPPLYGSAPGELGAFLYSPAFYQVVSLLQFLDWTSFAWIWAAINLATAIWLGPFALALPFTWLEVYHGNVNLLLAAAIVLGFRYPAAWAFVLLTKITPGIGLVWFAARGEWRSLAIALGATAAIAAASFAVAPTLWFGWVSLLAGSGQDPLAFGPPLLVRMPIAAVLVVWGSRTDRRWTVPVAACLALPNLWWHGLAVLAAVPLSQRMSFVSRRWFSGSLR